MPKYLQPKIQMNIQTQTHTRIYKTHIETQHTKNTHIYNHTKKHTQIYREQKDRTGNMQMFCQSKVNLSIYSGGLEFQSLVL